MPVKRAAPGPADKQKRTRFASPSPAAESSGSLEADDALLEEDLPEGAQNARARSRKQIKDTGGYGSDSSNDEEGVVPSRRPKTLEDDEDVDMFADDVEEKADKKGKGKEKEFMDLNDVEGQEFSRRDEEDSGSEEEEEMDEKAQRKRGIEKDLGIEVTPFNMKGEMEEGRFTADGEAYIANDRDEGEKHDVWLDDVDKDEIKKARRAHRERERLEKERQERESGGGKEGAEERKKKEMELMREALELMERGETVLEALQRLGKEAEDKRKKEEAGSKKKSWAERQKERKAAMAVDQAAT
jgi:CD2 antigen cytoplasmic tail-binding protein 2